MKIRTNGAHNGDGIFLTECNGNRFLVLRTIEYKKGEEAT